MTIAALSRRQLGSVAVMAGVLMAGCGDDTDHNGKVDCNGYRFPSKLWKETNTRPKEDDELRVRRQAADAVVDCALLDGQTKREVRRKLGRAHGRDPQGWTYVVGEERGPFVVDDEELHVGFVNGRVSEVRHGEG